MDMVRAELVAPLIVEGPRQEAQRVALADLAQPSSRPGHGAALAVWLGGLQIEVGCRLDAAGRKRATGIALALLPTPCGRTEWM